MVKNNLLIVVLVICLLFLLFDTYWLWTHKNPLCRRESCINLDATNQKCEADAKTIIEEKVKDRKIELRYSSKCDAGWSRSLVTPGSMLYVEDEKGDKYGYNYVVPDDSIKGKHYGNMGPGSRLKACIQILNGDQLCTKLAS